MGDEPGGVASLNAAACRQKVFVFASGDAAKLQFALGRRGLRINLCGSQSQPGVFFYALTKGARCLLNLPALPAGYFLLQLADSIKRLKQPAAGLLHLLCGMSRYSSRARSGRLVRFILLPGGENPGRL